MSDHIIDTSSIYRQFSCLITQHTKQVQMQLIYRCIYIYYWSVHAFSAGGSSDSVTAPLHRTADFGQGPPASHLWAVPAAAAAETAATGQKQARGVRTQPGALPQRGEPTGAAPARQHVHREHAGHLHLSGVSTAGLSWLWLHASPQPLLVGVPWRYTSSYLLGVSRHAKMPLVGPLWRNASRQPPASTSGRVMKVHLQVTV